MENCAVMLNNNRDVLPETWLQTAPSFVKHTSKLTTWSVFFIPFQI